MEEQLLIMGNDRWRGGEGSRWEARGEEEEAGGRGEVRGQCRKGRSRRCRSRCSLWAMIDGGMGGEQVGGKGEESGQPAELGACPLRSHGVWQRQRTCAACVCERNAPAACV